MQIHKNTLRNCALFILISIISNALYNNFAVSITAKPEYHTFLYYGDVFADYLKITLSYPDAKHVEILNNKPIHNILNNYIMFNPHRGIDGFAYENQITHFSSPPLVTLFFLMSLKMMLFIYPLWIYLSLLILTLILIIKLISYIYTEYDRLYVITLTIFSYPMLMGLQRGNIHALYCGLLIIIYLYLLNTKNKMLSVLALAFAVNIRPNALIFLPIVLCFGNKKSALYILQFLLFSGLIFCTATFLSHLIYHDYTYVNFLKGVSRYHELYVIGDGGLSNGSSLMGAFKFLFSYNKTAELITTLTPILFLLLHLWLFKKNKISYATLTFSFCAAYTLSSAVFADYHLLCFITPILLILKEYKNKNYVFVVKDYNTNIILTSA